MSKKIFKAADVKEIGSKVLITPPQIVPRTPVEEELELEAVEAPEVIEEEDLGPAVAPAAPVEDLESERNKLIEEARKIKEEAEQEVKKTKEEAEEAAFKLMQKGNADVRKLKEEAQREAESLLVDAKAKAAQIEDEAKRRAEAITSEAKSKAYEEGREKGYADGEEEVKRLVERLHVILNGAIDKRQEIIDYTEKQLVDLILLISRKIVKVLSEAEKGVVIENVRQALTKVKGETEITIRVNTRDLDLTTRHKKEFIAAVESLKHVMIEEDSRVDPGGCIIETSFGDIDARIQTQLNVIEERIRELIPIKE